MSGPLERLKAALEAQVCLACRRWFEERAAEVFAAAVAFVEKRGHDLAEWQDYFRDRFLRGGGA